LGEVHAPQEPESTLHWNVAPLSGDEKLKDGFADWVAAGVLVRVTTGPVMSTTQLRDEGAVALSPMRPRTWKVRLPSGTEL
jgi:hypothetical protein